MLLQHKHRVVNIREGYTVPVNLRGTIIGRHIQGNVENQIMFDVYFDQEFMGGMSLGLVVCLLFL